jgi:hypothetical protein
MDRRDEPRGLTVDAIVCGGLWPVVVFGAAFCIDAGADGVIELPGRWAGTRRVARGDSPAGYRSGMGLVGGIVLTLAWRTGRETRAVWRRWHRR